jgi:putative transposase
MVDMSHKDISVSRQCDLLSLCRSSLYYSASPQNDGFESALNLELMRLIDEKYLQCPFYGSRKMTAWLKETGYYVNRKRISRLMNTMDIHTIYPKKKRSTNTHPDHRIFPYLLKDLSIRRANHVWSTDITYIPMRKGFIYLVAIMDWYSRYVISWEVSTTLEKEFCISALERALGIAQPQIFNTDQGAQFTSPSFFQILLNKEIAVSMDGRGRAFDNIFIERLWRTVKYEEVYLKGYDDVPEAVSELGRYFDFYNNERHHQALGYKKPVEIYFQQEVNQEVSN